MGLEFIVYLVLLFVPVALYGIYYFHSNYVNRKNHLDEGALIPSKTFTIKIDLDSQTYTMLFRNHRNMPSVSYNKQKFEAMFISEQGVKEWRSWLRALQKKDATVPELLTTVVPPTSKNQSLVRIKLVSFNEKDEIVYLQATWVQRADYNKINQAAELDAFAFRARLNNILKESKYPTGTMIVFNFNRYDYVKRRYDQEGLQQYLAAIWNVFASFDDGHEVATGIYKFDSFIVYGKIVRTRKDVQVMVDNVRSKIGTYISAAGFEIEVDAKVGYSSFGEFSASPEMVMRQAYNASVVAAESKTDIKHYDSELDKAYQNEMWLIMLLRETIKRDSLTPLFEPIISLDQGTPIGAFAYIDFNKTKFVSFANAYKIALDNSFDGEFLENVVSRIMNTFNDDPKNNKQTVFGFCHANMLEKVLNVYRKSKTFKGIKLVMVIYDYDVLISHKEYVRVIENMNRQDLELGIVANDKMETAIHPVLGSFTYVVWPQELIEKVLVDDKALVTFKNIYATMASYNLISVARGVNSYDLAEYLKDMGILDMAGSIFGHGETTAEKNYSVRRLNKLIGKDYE